METGVLSATKEGHSFSGFALLISLVAGVGFEPMPSGLWDSTTIRTARRRGIAGRRPPGAVKNRN